MKKQIVDTKLLNEVAARHGATITSVSRGDIKTFASVEFEFNGQTYTVEKGVSGKWFNGDVFTNFEARHSSSINTVVVGLSYSQLLNSYLALGGQETAEAMIDDVLLRVEDDEGLDSPTPWGAVLFARWEAEQDELYG